MEFNINNYVLVKLNEIGEEELKRQHEELMIIAPKLGPYEPRKVDEDGFSKWQMWDLMHTFGHMVSLGSKVPFETTIIIPNTTNRE